MITHLGQKVLVTGATGALGHAVIEKYLTAGSEITATFHKSPEKQFAGSKKICWIQADLTDSQSVNQALSGKSFDVAIHCTGGFRYALIDQLTDIDINFLIDTNLKSSFFLARALLQGMKEKNFGRIVFVSSKATLQMVPGMGAYTASKAGLNMLTTVLAEEVKNYDIAVNAVLPTIIDTPTNRRDMPHANFSDWVTPQQLAEIIFSITSPWGNPIRGALIPVAGRL
jgi:NAD(P)-dependent dehydrogenase (short-subunit alcohol dehydrogenase family)